MENSTDIGYLHFGEGSEPRQTVSVKVRCLHSDNWQAFYAAKWRKVYIQKGKTFLKMHNKNIQIQIEGV